jgi:ubiquitin fusion degradation protein 1
MLSILVTHSKPKLITSAMLDAAASSATAGAKPLDLPLGTLFFGYPVVPYTPPATPPTQTNAATTTGTSNSRPSGNTGTTGVVRGGIGLSVMDSLRGGNTLSGRPTPRSATPVSVPEVVVSRPPAESAAAGTGAPAHDWGSGGHTLGSARSSGVKKTGEKKKKKKEVIELD